MKILLKELTAKLDDQLNRAAGRVVERPYLQETCVPRWMCAVP